jgi:glutamate synthase (NADPH/NADH) small chain
VRVERIVPKSIPPGERKDFSEVYSSFAFQEALFEARRCLYCYDAPCVKGCPTGVNIPEFISRIKSGNLIGAARLIYSANPLGSVCGRVCPTEVLCERSCTSKLLNIPIAIGHLQRYVCDFALENERVSFPYPQPQKGPIAVVGGGPAGLSCIHFLKLLGYRVTLFEREEEPGGLLLNGIPPYRLPEKTARKEISLILQGVEIGKGIETKEDALRVIKEFKAIFLSPGANKPVSLGVPGEDQEGVISAGDFLKEVSKEKGQFDFSGKVVAILGGGASAMDASRVALRLNASRVIVLYRRTREEMPAFPSEFQEALEEGVEFLWLVQPVEIKKRDGRLFLTLERMTLKEPDESGRRAPKGTGETFEMACDILIKAIAAFPDPRFLEIWPGLKLDPRGYPLENNRQSTNPKIFLGGDLIKGGTVVQAVADGKEGARRIDEWLKGGGAQ